MFLALCFTTGVNLSPQVCADGDWECVYPKQADTTSTKCTTGEYKCFDHGVGRCSFGGFIIYPCAEGTKCVDGQWHCARQ